MNSSIRSIEPLDPGAVSSRHVFRGIEYVVTVMVDNNKEIFSLEVEDRLTSDQWRGQFDARCKLSTVAMLPLNFTFCNFDYVAQYL